MIHLSATEFPSGVDIDQKPVGHLPLIRAIIDDLGIVGVLDELLPPDPRSRVSDGECVAAMILNILQGRVALYSMEQWLASTDCELLFGEGCEADAFNDARLATCLDHIAARGTEQTLSGVISAYLCREHEVLPRAYSVHHDITSIKVYGAYAGWSEEPGPEPTHGFSKDRRPDLKQLVFGLALHGSVGIPLTSAMYDGNESDSHSNRVNLDQLADLLPEQDEVTVVGDCKLVDARTIGQILDHHFHFVSLVPHTFKSRAELVEEVRRSEEPMPELARQPGRTKKDAPNVYRGRSVDRPFVVGLANAGTLREEMLRFLVVESSQLDGEESATIEHRKAKEREQFEAAFRKVAKLSYSCAEDAAAAVVRLTRGLDYHRATTEVIVESVAEKRRPGRPRSDEAAPTRDVYRPKLLALEEDAAAVERAHFHARHFVLVTDHLDRVAWPDQRVLAEYRHQYLVEGQTGFRWLKNTATVAPVLLHTPARIAALGVVLVLALMVRNYLQFTLRRRLAETGATVPDRVKKPTRMPTAETAIIAFARIASVCLYTNGRLARRDVTPLGVAAKTILRLLGIPESIFTSPRPRKPPHSVAEIPGM